MKLTTLEVAGLGPAIHGMRNPKNSWHKSDTKLVQDNDGIVITIGPKDKELAQKLIKGGPVHAKFMRQIMVWVDITAPIYWWSEFDTYKVGVTRNSCSTMHKLIQTIDALEQNEEFREWYNSPRWADRMPPSCVLDLYEVHPSDSVVVRNVMAATRNMYTLVKSAGDKGMSVTDLKRTLKKMLPSSWLQTATISMSYENLRNMVRWRRHHELVEWNPIFCDWVKTLPYAKDLIFYGLEEEDG